MVRYYKIFKDNKLYCEGYCKDIMSKLHWTKNELNNFANWNRNGMHKGYTIEWESVAKVKQPTKKPKKEDPYDCIVRHLKLYGNTSLIKSEYQYLDRLKKEFNLDTKIYKKGKSAYGGVYDKEDMVITWLDFRKYV